MPVPLPDTKLVCVNTLPCTTIIFIFYYRLERVSQGNSWKQKKNQNKKPYQNGQTVRGTGYKCVLTTRWDLQEIKTAKKRFASFCHEWKGTIINSGNSHERCFALITANGKKNKNKLSKQGKQMAQCKSTYSSISQI